MNYYEIIQNTVMIIDSKYDDCIIISIIMQGLIKSNFDICTVNFISIDSFFSNAFSFRVSYYNYDLLKKSKCFQENNYCIKLSQDFINFYQDLTKLYKSI